MNELMHCNHEFLPEYQKDSRILILGSFPSVKSREQGFYYGHQKNRFYKVLASVFQNVEQNEEVMLLDTIDEKKLFLKKYHIALWDVIESCDIIGSSDSSIRNVTICDIAKIVKNSDIQKIYANGKLAGKLYEKYCKKDVGINAITLPSTSPANASYSLEKLIESWKRIKDY